MNNTESPALPSAKVSTSTSSPTFYHIKIFSDLNMASFTSPGVLDNLLSNVRELIETTLRECEWEILRPLLPEIANSLEKSNLIEKEKKLLLYSIGRSPSLYD